MRKKIATPRQSTWLVSLALVVTAIFVLVGAQRSAHAHTAPATVVSGARAARPTGSSVSAAYGRLPMAFEKNQGQTDSAVQYVSHGKGYELFLTPGEAVLALRAAIPGLPSPANPIAYNKALIEASRSQKASVFRLQFEGALTNPEITAEDKLTRNANYFVGNDPSKWQTNVPSYSQVKYKGIYSGVDLLFYGNQSRLEYDFIVAPGADASQIALRAVGPRKLRVTA